MLVTGQKLLASEQIKYSAFLVLCWYYWKQDKRFISSKKIQWNNHKGKSKYLFIYLFIYLLFIYLFIYYLFIFFLGNGLSVFFIIQN